MGPFFSSVIPGVRFIREDTRMRDRASDPELKHLEAALDESRRIRGELIKQMAAWSGSYPKGGASPPAWTPDKGNPLDSE